MFSNTQMIKRHFVPHLKKYLLRRIVPYDFYERHAVVDRVLEQNLAEDRNNSCILDVGGRAGLLGRYAGRTGLAINVDGSGDLFGSGTALPFPDSSFDAVVTIDTLEHLPRAKRQDMVLECWRVARHLLLIAAPYGSPAHCDHEKDLDRYHRTVCGYAHPYLAEHIRFGLPSGAEIQSIVDHVSPSSSALYFAGNYIWQGRSFARSVRAHGLPILQARALRAYDRLASLALFHPIRLSTVPYPAANRFYLTMGKWEPEYS